MIAYIIFTRERTHDVAELETYAGKAAASAQGHPVKPLAYYGEIETLEGPEAEGSVILEFPDRAAAHSWYASDAYQDARKHRFAGADYRVFIVDGVA